jgi:alkylated DNA nucleotide flippase Atl1
VAGSFSVLQPPEMQTLLERDYDAMTMMITGQVPTFADVMTVIGVPEQRLRAGR